MASKQMVTAKASKPGKKRHVRAIHVTPSKNGGAAIETHFHPTPAKKSSAMDDAAAPYMAEQPESEMHTTQTPEQTGAHVASMLATGYPPTGDNDGDEGEPAAQ